MCGICGVVSFQPETPVDKSILLRMNQSLRHRGPDDDGYYQDSQASLAMRRLSIIDLHTGQQPITNETGDVWVVYNGEIYNYRELRSELERRGHIFKTQTDTEVIVHAYEQYGDDCVNRFNGMFSIALWDQRRRRLLLARDRLGIKPLYYWQSQSSLVFASELKALLHYPDVSRQTNLAALDLFLTLEYIPAPRTALAVNTNSPSDSLAGTESEVPVPGPVTSPPISYLKLFSRSCNNSSLYASTSSSFARL